MSSVIDPKLIGEAWSPVEPFDDPDAYGSVRLECRPEYEVRSHATFKMIYTAGKYGIDDTGAIRVYIRSLGDWGVLQTDDPEAPNHVSAATNGQAKPTVDYYHRGVGTRPRNRCLTVGVRGGYLQEGETITVIIGDTSQGSPGFLLQTFAEPVFEFKVAVDVCATGHFTPLDDPLSLAIVPGPPTAWKAVLPSLRRPGEEFRLGIKAEDRWGNPTPKAQGLFRLESDLKVSGLPARLEYDPGQRSVSLEGLSVSEEGILRIRLRDESGGLAAETNPLVIKDGEAAGFWGDLHGQSGETVGSGTAEEFFWFAREAAFLDVTSHQANDFQVTNEFWSRLNRLTARFNRDGRFVVFPGYEWSGNTGVGGDHNVYFKEEGCQVRRSSHALLEDRSDIETDAPDTKALFADLAEEDCAIYAHVGGRYANIPLAHDGRLRTAMEIHSAWGTFEWLLEDCFSLGHRVGVVCNSDDHKGRPGASYPGASTFGAYGGLTCFLAEELTREAIFECLRRRHHYGTTGTRPHLEVEAIFNEPARVFDRDPKAYDKPACQVSERAIMGDIVRTPEERIRFRVGVAAQAGIERLEIRNGTETLQTFRPYGDDDLGCRIRVVWAGAEYRGRGREVSWRGEARFTGAEIRDWRAINAWNPDRQPKLIDNRTIRFDSITTGNFAGFDAWLEENDGARLAIETAQGSLDLALAELDSAGTGFEAGGLGKRLGAYRLPDEPLDREMETEIRVDLKPAVDNPLWVCLTLEDGSQAWSSPIYVFREDGPGSGE